MMQASSKGAGPGPQAVSTGSTASLVEAKTALARDRPAWALVAQDSAAPARIGATALVWEGAVQLFGIRPLTAASEHDPDGNSGDASRLSRRLPADISQTLDRICDRRRLRRAHRIASSGAGAARDGLPISCVADHSVIAFGALVVLWFGNTLLAKAVIAFYLTFFPVTVNTLLGLETSIPGSGA